MLDDRQAEALESAASAGRPRPGHAATVAEAAESTDASEAPRPAESTILTLPRGIGVAHSEIALDLVALGRWSEAERRHEVAVDVLDQARAIPYKAEVHRRLGEIQRDQGRTAEARAGFEVALRHFAELGDEAQLALIAEELSAL